MAQNGRVTAAFLAMFDVRESEDNIFLRWILFQWTVTLVDFEIYKWSERTDGAYQVAGKWKQHCGSSLFSFKYCFFLCNAKYEIVKIALKNVMDVQR